MKPLTITQKCLGKSSSQVLSSFLLLLQAWLRDLLKPIRLAIPGCLAGSKDLLGNQRLRSGFTLMGVAPILYMAHSLFIVTCPEHNIGSSPLSFISDPHNQAWFYHHRFFWLYTNREELFFATGLAGFFLLCPQKWDYRYLLAPLVAACVVEILFQSFLINHWSHFYLSFLSLERGWEVIVVAVVAMYSGMKVIDYTVYRKYHINDGNIARIIGVIRMKNTPIDQKMKILETLLAEQESYNARV